MVYGYNSEGNVYGSLTNTSCGDGALVTTLTSEWKRVWIVWKTGTASNMSSGVKNVLVARIPSGATTNEAHICGVKFEKSSLPTDYSEAPEDIEAKYRSDTNLFKGSSYDGGYIAPSTPTNKWEFVEGTMSAYELYQFKKYGALFSDGQFDLYPQSNGTAYLYSPYIYFAANAAVTFHIEEWDWGDNDTEMQVVRFSTAATARDLQNGTVAATIQIQ